MRTTIAALMALTFLACGDTDVENRGQDVAPGQEVEDSGLELDVEPVDLETTAWFTEGRTVAFGERDWIVVGEPVFDPAVERVGEFEGTPLYAEVGVAEPYDALFIPLERDLWQMLEPATGGAAVPLDTTMSDTAAEDSLTEIR